MRVYQFRHIRAGGQCSRSRRHFGTRGPARRRYAGAVSTDPLRTLLERAFPDATELEVVDRTGGGDHFQVVVSAPSLDGLTLVQQHRRVYDALSEPLGNGTIHELRIKTRGAT